MAEIRRSGTWGSALSTNEFAAIRSTGFEPAGQVLGAAVYNVGYTGGVACPGAWGGVGPFGAPPLGVTPGSGGGDLRPLRPAGGAPDQGRPPPRRPPRPPAP